MITPREKHGTVFYDGQVFVFGGYSRDSDIRLCESFSLSKNRWSKIASLPDESQFTTAVTMGVYIYVTGFNLPNIFEYDPYQNVFKDIGRRFTQRIYKSLIKTTDSIIIFSDSQPTMQINFEGREKSYHQIPISLKKPQLKGN